jgi:hypothetical protein
MCERERNVGKERFTGGRVSFDEINGAVRDLRFHGSPVRYVQFRNLPGFVALARFENGFRRNDVRVPALFCADRRPQAIRLVRIRPHRLGVTARDAVPFVKALMRRKSLFGAAEMPFAPHTRGVALCR